MLTGARPQHAHTGFDGGRAAVVELVSLQIARQDLGEFFTEQRLDLGREIVGVHQLPGVFCHRFADLRMAMPQCGHVDAGAEINVLVAVDIAQRATLAGLKRYREQLHLPRQPLKILGASVMPMFRLGTGYRLGHDFRILGEVQCIGSRVKARFFHIHHPL